MVKRDGMMVKTRWRNGENVMVYDGESTMARWCDGTMAQWGKRDGTMVRC
jgi:hypothetical protein